MLFYVIRLIKCKSFLLFNLNKDRRNVIRIFKLYLPIELFDRIKLMADFYQISISKMMTQLMEIGYLEMLKINTKELRKETDK